jgi:hypothetical protein
MNEVDKTIDDMLKKSVIQPSHSQGSMQIYIAGWRRSMRFEPGQYHRRRNRGGA